MPSLIFRLPAVKEITGLSTATIYRRMEDGSFPRPISLGGRSVGWIASEIEEFIEQQRKKRDRALSPLDTWHSNQH